MAEVEAAKKEAEKNVVPWGPFEAIFSSLGLYIVPNILLVIFLVVLAGLGLELINFDEDLSVGQNFALYGMTEILIVSGLLFILYIKKAGLKTLGFTTERLKQAWQIIPAYFVYFVITLVILGISGLFLSQETLDADQELGFESATALWEYTLAFISLVLIAPIVEEMLFRGYLYKGLRTKWGVPASALVSSVLFGLAHLQINVALDTFALALVLAYLMEATNNLWIPIGLHMLKNLVAFTFLFVLEI